MTWQKEAAKRCTDYARGRTFKGSSFPDAVDLVKMQEIIADTFREEGPRFEMKRSSGPSEGLYDLMLGDVMVYRLTARAIRKHKAELNSALRGGGE